MLILNVIPTDYVIDLLILGQKVERLAHYAQPVYLTVEAVQLKGNEPLAHFLKDLGDSGLVPLASLHLDALDDFSSLRCLSKEQLLVVSSHHVDLIHVPRPADILGILRLIEGELVDAVIELHYQDEG